MKVTIDIDCTPEEARAFLGLPDVGPMQDEIMTQVTAQMKKNLAAMDGEALFRTWFPTLGGAPGGAASGDALTGLGEMQRAFWEEMMKGFGAGGGGKTS